MLLVSCHEQRGAPESPTGRRHCCGSSGCSPRGGPVGNGEHRSASREHDEAARTWSESKLICPHACVPQVLRSANVQNFGELQARCFTIAYNAHFYSSL